MTFLKFTEVKDTGKTKVWLVENSNDGSRLGLVKWHGAWRKYVLVTGATSEEARKHHVDPTIIWSPDCLKDVVRFIETEMDKRKPPSVREAQLAKMQSEYGDCLSCGVSMRSCVEDSRLTCCTSCEHPRVAVEV